MNKNIKHFIMLILLAVAGNACAVSHEIKPFSSAQWYFNVRTNLNSAAFITGIAAAWHAVYYGVLPVTKAGAEYAVGKIQKAKLISVLKRAKGNLTKSIFLAGLALAFEGANKYHFRTRFYEKVNA